MTDEAKKYLHEKEIPKLFEGLMTGLIHHRPTDPVGFMQSALREARGRDDINWDTFVRSPPPPPAGAPPYRSRTNSRSRSKLGSRRPSADASKSIYSHDGVTAANREAATFATENGAGAVSSNGMGATDEPVAPGDEEDDDVVDVTEKKAKSKKSSSRNNKVSPAPSDDTSKSMRNGSSSNTNSVVATSSSVNSHASHSALLGSNNGDPPIILFMGGPGLGKTRHAYRLAKEFTEHKLVHICTPDLIKAAILKHKDTDKEWAEAGRKYEAGELISADLAMDLVRNEMKKSSTAKAYLLEGFPRDLKQVKAFEQEISKISLAIILDFDEVTLSQQMASRGLQAAEYKTKTLPAAKYFDDKMLLHLIAGEQDPETLLDQSANLVKIALGLKPPPEIPNDRFVPPPIVKNGSNHNAPSSARPSSSNSNSTSKVSNYSNDDVPTGLPNDAPVILIIGAPGSNKQEYCRRVIAKYDGFVHVSMGELLRAEIEKHPSDKKWKGFREKMAQGDYVPTRECRHLLYTALHAKDKPWGYVIDGYPRNTEQAKDFEKTAGRVDLVLLVDCTEAFCVKSLKKRSENTSTKRIDDSPAAIQQRLSLFKRNTLHMLKYFEDKNKLKVVRAKPKVDGEKGMNEIFAMVTDSIDKKLFMPESTGGSEEQSMPSNS